MILIFVFENCQNLFSWSLPFGPFWSAKYQVLEVKAERSEFCPVRFRKQTLGKANKQVLLFSDELRTNFVRSHGLKSVKSAFSMFM